MSDFVSISIKDRIGVVTIDQPRTRNALDWSMQQRFAEIVDDCMTSNAIRALVITGRGNTFAAGGNIRDQLGRYDRETGARLKQIMSDALIALTTAPFPTIAAINGNAYGGGCELLTACDLRVMSADARLNFVQAKMGLTTGWGGTARLVHLVGASRAMELLLTAQGISAATALRIGLVQRVVTDDVLVAALDWAHQLIQLPHNALGALKQLVWRSTTLDAGYSAEADLFVQQWQHPNHIEAVNAFIEKREPHYNNERNR